MRSVFWVITTLGMCTGCGGSTIAQQAATYFNLTDGGEFTYVSPAGLTEVHTYSAVTEEGADDEVQTFARTARRGGFLQDDQTVTFETNADRQLLINRYYDCVTRCGELSTPIIMVEQWPLEGGQSAESTTLVRMTRNGDDDGERTETHRFAVGEEAPITVPAGTFEEAFTIVWTRTIDGTSASANLVIARNVGFVVFEDFGGQRFELESGPLPDENGE